LIVVITNVKSSHLCLQGSAKYKYPNETFQIIRWKYFFPINEPLQVITTGDIVFFSGKYIIENSDQCLTVGYASILSTRNSSHKSNIINIPPYIPYFMFLASITRVPKKVKSFIHFGVECLEYNPVT
ncbi:12435_t:CDS:1, partial [Dentiscutata erythropus]